MKGELTKVMAVHQQDCPGPEARVILVAACLKQKNNNKKTRKLIWVDRKVMTVHQQGCLNHGVQATSRAACNFTKKTNRREMDNGRGSNLKGWKEK